MQFPRTRHAAAKMKREGGRPVGSIECRSLSMRDSTLDNAKGVLITLVVLGHYLEAFDGWSSPPLRFLLTAVYMFHMPAFVFLAGITAPKHNVGNRVAFLGVLLIAFQLAYLAPQIAKGNVFSSDLITPYWILWFLLSMIWWIGLLPVLLKSPAPLLISVGVSVAAGLFQWAEYPLSLGRTLVFLPFFVAGHLFGGRMLSKSARQGRWQRLMLLLVILGGAASLFVLDVQNHWFYGAFPYSSLGVAGWEACLTRFGLIVVAAACTFAFIGLVPSSRGWLSTIGRNSLAVFLLHGFVVKVVGKLLGHIELPTLFILTLVVIIAVATTICLSVGVFDRAIRGAVTWVIAWFGRRRRTVFEMR